MSFRDIFCSTIKTKISNPDMTATQGFLDLMMSKNCEPPPTPLKC